MPLSRQKTKSAIVKQSDKKRLQPKQVIMAKEIPEEQVGHNKEKNYKDWRFDEDGVSDRLKQCGQQQVLVRQQKKGERQKRRHNKKTERSKSKTGEKNLLSLPGGKTKTPKEKLRIRREKYREFWAKLPEEERERRRKHHSERVRLRRANFNEEDQQRYRKQRAEYMKLKRANLNEEERNLFKKMAAESQKLRRAKLNEEEHNLFKKMAAESQKLRRAKLNEEELTLLRKGHAEAKRLRQKRLNEEQPILDRAQHTETEKEKRAQVIGHLPLLLPTELPKGRNLSKLIKDNNILVPNDNEDDNAREIMTQIKKLKITVTSLKKASLELIKNCAESAVVRCTGGKVLSDRRSKTQQSKTNGGVLYKRRRQPSTNWSREIFIIPCNNEQFVCIVCNEEFVTQGRVKSHFACHTEVEMSEAKEKYVLKISEGALDGKSECVNLNTYRCEVCSEKIYMIRNYMKHIIEKHKENRELLKKITYPCSFCDEAFTTRKVLTVHQRDLHNIFTQCPVCRENFESQETFAKHLEETHTDCQKKGGTILEYAEGFFCKVCGYNSRSYNNALTHFKEAHSELSKHFQCDICEEKFSTKNRLSRHTGTVHKEKLFCCELCGKQFHKVNALRLHNRTHKTDTTVQVEAKVQCKECGKTFANKSSYMVHYMSAHKKERHYRCTICEKTFTCPSNLDQHKITVCEKDKAVAKSCPTCGKRLDNYLLLYYHKTNIHKYGNTEENVCHLCQRTFKHCSGLFNHNKFYHNNPKGIELKCVICDKTRPNMKSLLEHWRLHRDEQPFKCSLCEMTFKGAHKFYVHKKNEHKNEEVAKLITDSEVNKKLKADFNAAHVNLLQNDTIIDDNLNTAAEDKSKTTANTTTDCNLSDNIINVSLNGEEEISDQTLCGNKNYIDFSRANVPVSAEARLMEMEEEPTDISESRVDSVDCEQTRDEDVTENSSMSKENSVVANKEMGSSTDDIFELFEPPSPSPMEYSDDSITIDEKPFIFGKNFYYKDPFEKRLVVEIKRLDDKKPFVYEKINKYKDPFEKRLKVEIERLDECHTCKEVFSSSDVYKNHLSSKGHRAAVRAKKRKAMLIKKIKKEKLKSDARKVNLKQRNEIVLFSCPFCEEKFKSVRKYRLHTAQHKKRAKCLNCAESFTSFRKLVDHYISEHNGEHIVKCDICDLGFLEYKRRHLQLHKRNRHGKDKGKNVNINRGIFCDICGKKTMSFQLFRDHILSHENDTLLHKCVHCAKEFKALIQLRNHYNETHNGEMPFPCGNCLRKFPTELSLQFHEKKAHGQPRKDKFEGKEVISCSFCNEKFTSVQKYLRHKVQHQKRKRANCLICPEEFPTVRKLVDHYISNHNGENIVKCEICDKPFLEYQERNLREHVTLQHGGGKKSRVKENYSCDVCGEISQGQKLFKTHLLSHANEKCKCMLCTQEFKSFVELESHYKDFHNGKMPFPCGECSLTFPIQIRLQLHQKAAHPKVKNSIRSSGELCCEFCGKSFQRVHSLNIHRREHTGEKPYPCTQCEMAFVSPAILKQHIDTIHMKNSYLCDTCGRAFNRRKYLVSHNKTHHSSETTICSICSEECRKPGTLKKHMKLHDPNRPFGCDQCSWRFMHSRNLNLHKKGVHQKMGTIYPKKKK